MVKRCVAAGCSNTYKDGVSLYTFPKDGEMRQRWAKQVQRTRMDWTGPSDHSVLCSDHFIKECFEVNFLVSSDTRTNKLKPGAIPTVFTRPAVSKRKHSELVNRSAEFGGCDQIPKKKRVAYEKRKNLG
uniref:THAP-type domain-containing protein n=1 Tax=Amphimedon queenslandica TaxID=400682 RepID=A0A1X7T9Y5_AMPQE